MTITDRATLVAYFILGIVTYKVSKFFSDARIVLGADMSKLSVDEYTNLEIVERAMLARTR